MIGDKPKVAFICVHNSCRSQIAEALATHFAYDSFVSFSAGTEIASQINQDAVRLVKQLYGIDMEVNQYSKLVDDIPDVDVVITLGCNVECPIISSDYIEDWGIEDPTGKSDEEFIQTIRLIEAKIFVLRDLLNKGEK